MASSASITLRASGPSQATSDGGAVPMPSSESDLEVVANQGAVELKMPALASIQALGAAGVQGPADGQDLGSGDETGGEDSAGNTGSRGDEKDGAGGAQEAQEEHMNMLVPVPLVPTVQRLIQLHEAETIRALESQLSAILGVGPGSSSEEQLAAMRRLIMGEQVGGAAGVRKAALKKSKAKPKRAGRKPKQEEPDDEDEESAFSEDDEQDDDAGGADYKLDSLPTKIRAELAIIQEAPGYAGDDFLASIVTEIKAKLNDEKKFSEYLDTLSTDQLRTLQLDPTLNERHLKTLGPKFLRFFHADTETVLRSKREIFSAIRRTMCKAVALSYGRYYLDPKTKNIRHKQCKVDILDLIESRADGKARADVKGKGSSNSWSLFGQR